MSGVPGDKIETVITFLEMTKPPAIPAPPPPKGPMALLKAELLSVAFYRFLYNTVGKDFLWWERRVLSDEALAEVVLTENVDVYVLYVGGVPAGFFELNEDGVNRVVDLAYFGLMPDFIGAGYGRYMLRAAIDEAWRRNPERVTVNTCTLDHESALPTYQKAGFQPYDQVKRIIDDPRSSGLF